MAISSEDKKIIKYLAESYDSNALDSTIDMINEYVFDTYNQTTSSQKTTGMHDRGVKGALRALPSAILTTAIYWPGALLALVGALSLRSQKHWLKSVFNTDNWLDFISTSYKEKGGRDNPAKGPASNSSSNIQDSSVISAEEYEKMSDEEKEEYIKKLYKENIKTYYAVMSNGEIFRVRAIDEITARQIFDKIIEFNPYDEMQRRLAAGGIAYMIYFNDFEQAIWVAADKEQARDEAMMSRRQLDATYAKIGVTDPLRQTGLKVVDITELKDQKNITRPDLGYRITEQIPLSYRNTGPKSNEEYYTDQRTGVWTYRTRNSDCIYSYPARNNGEANKIAMELYLFTKKYFIVNEKLFKKNEGYCYYKVSFTDGDSYIVCAKNSEEADRFALKIQDTKIQILLNQKIGAVSKMMNNTELPEIKKTEKFADRQGNPVPVKWNWRLLTTKAYNKQTTDSTPETEVKRRAVTDAAMKYVPPVKGKGMFEPAEAKNQMPVQQQGQLSVKK